MEGGDRDAVRGHRQEDREAVRSRRSLRQPLLRVPSTAAFPVGWRAVRGAGSAVLLLRRPGGGGPGAGGGGSAARGGGRDRRPSHADPEGGPGGGSGGHPQG